MKGDQDGHNKGEYVNRRYKVLVKLHGTLMKLVPNYNHHADFEVDIPEKCDVEALLRILKIPKSKAGIILLNGKLANASDKIKENDMVQLFHPIFGG